MSVAVLVPFQADAGHRDRNWEWCRAWWMSHHPNWPIIMGAASEQPFNRAPAICDAASRADADILVIVDADVWCDGITDAVKAVQDGAPWAIPHGLLHRLDEPTTDRVLAGGELEPVGYDQRPYAGHPAGTLLVMSAGTFVNVPPDRRFSGWGQEDDAWAIALMTLVGQPWRGTADLWHLWHPHPARLTRRIGNLEGQRLYRSYVAALGNPEQIRALVQAGR